MEHLRITDNSLQGGKYKLIRFIGSGGFGCTYEAEHELLHKRVAIKELYVKDFSQYQPPYIRLLCWNIMWKRFFV